MSSRFMDRHQSSFTVFMLVFFFFISFPVIDPRLDDDHVIVNEVTVLNRLIFFTICISLSKRRAYAKYNFNSTDLKAAYLSILYNIV